MYLDVCKSVHHHNSVNIVLFNQPPEVRLCRRQWHLCNDVIILSPEALVNIRKNTVNSAYKELIGTMKNQFLITGVPYKRTLNLFLAKDLGMKISFL